MTRFAPRGQQATNGRFANLSKALSAASSQTGDRSITAGLPDTPGPRAAEDDAVSAHAANGKPRMTSQRAAQLVAKRNAEAAARKEEEERSASLRAVMQRAERERAAQAADARRQQEAEAGAVAKRAEIDDAWTKAVRAVCGSVKGEDPANERTGAVSTGNAVWDKVLHGDSAALHPAWAKVLAQVPGSGVNAEPAAPNSSAAIWDKVIARAYFGQQLNSKEYRRA